MDDLVLQYMPLVKSIARKQLDKVPFSIRLDDLVSAGTVGLIEALQRYKPDTGFTVMTFLWPRIHGAIQDELRRCNHGGRNAHKHWRQKDHIITVDGETIDLLESLPDDDNPETSVVVKQIREKLYMFVSELPDRERRLFELLHQQGIDSYAAAADLKMSRSWVMQANAKLIRKLRERFEDRQ